MNVVLSPYVRSLDLCSGTDAVSGILHRILNPIVIQQYTVRDSSCTHFKQFILISASLLPFLIPFFPRLVCVCAH